MLSEKLGPVELRVLGSLIEKELATPDHYPLSLSTLTNACNQLTNREPVMTLDGTTVSSAVAALRRMNLVRSLQGVGSRVPKYQHLLADATDLSKTELAILCVLMLRGSQTLAAVRSRSVRLTLSDGAEAIEAALEKLCDRAPAPAVVRLPRRPGQKEMRYAQLLGGEVNSGEPEESSGEAAVQSSVDRITALEDAVGELRGEVAALRSQFAEFRRQFE
jgi:hypothetical protein